MPLHPDGRQADRRAQQICHVTVVATAAYALAPRGAPRGPNYMGLSVSRALTAPGLRSPTFVAIE